MKTQQERHQGDERQFNILSQSWYASANQSPEQQAAGEDEITLGFYCNDSGTSGEFTIAWRPLDGRLVPQLRAYHDSWSALSLFGDVLRQLAAFNDDAPTVEEVAEVLRNCGVKDVTQRTSPYEKKGHSSHAHVLGSLLTVYVTAFNNLRLIGRTGSGDREWARGVEFDEPLVAAKGVPEAVMEELRHQKREVQRLRQELATAVGTDVSLARQYAHLLKAPTQ